jgi:hypothetical protein
MPPRRLNDRQVERFLAALHSVEYRQALAARLAGTTDKKSTAYRSQMRRLQLYISQGQVRRSYARSPAPVRQVTRKAARHIPYPENLPPPQYKTPVPVAQTSRPKITFFRDVEPSPLPPAKRRPRARDVSEFDIQALVAYHDGDAEETGEALGVSARATGLLELATMGDTVEVLGARGSGELIEPIREFFEFSEDKDDVEDFIDLIGNLPGWQKGMIFDDLRSGGTTFADILDAWRADDMVYRKHGDEDDEDLSESAYWELWRAIYARQKA